jgi:Mor family transcriptional regulator
LYIPMEIDQGHPIAAVLGLAHAKALAQQYGGARQLVPMRIDQRARDEAIVQARAEGATMAELARVFDLSPRAIRYVLSRKAESRRIEQLSLL